MQYNKNYLGGSSIKSCTSPPPPPKHSHITFASEQIKINKWASMGVQPKEMDIIMFVSENVTLFPMECGWGVE